MENLKSCFILVLIKLFAEMNSSVVFQAERVLSKKNTAFYTQMPSVLYSFELVFLPFYDIFKTLYCPFNFHPRREKKSLFST